MSGREEQQKGNLWQYVQSRVAGEDKRKLQEYLQQLERNFQLLDAPVNIRELLAEYGVRQLLKEIKQGFVNWSSALLTPVRPDVQYPKEWGYTLEYVTHGHYETVRQSSHWSVGAGTVFEGGGQAWIPTSTEREIRIVAESILPFVVMPRRLSEGGWVNVSSPADLKRLVGDYLVRDQHGTAPRCFKALIPLHK